MILRIWRWCPSITDPLCIFCGAINRWRWGWGHTIDVTPLPAIADCVRHSFLPVVLSLMRTTIKIPVGVVVAAWAKKKKRIGGGAGLASWMMMMMLPRCQVRICLIMQHRPGNDIPLANTVCVWEWNPMQATCQPTLIHCTLCQQHHDHHHGSLFSLFFGVVIRSIIISVCDSEEETRGE